jgi:hypothetical protein
VGFLVGNDCPVSPTAALHDMASVELTLARYVAEARMSATERLLLESYLVRLCCAGLRGGVLQAKAKQAFGKPGPIFQEPNPLAPASLEAELVQCAPMIGARQRYNQLKAEGWVEKGLRWEVNPWLIRSIVIHPGGPADSLAVRPETYETMRREWQLCSGLLHEMRQATREQGVDLVFLAIPNAHLVSQRWVDFLRDRGCLVTDDMVTSRVVNQWLADFCKANDLPCIDPLDTFREEESKGNMVYLETDDHMTPMGHRLLGQALAEGLHPIISSGR